MTEIKLLGLPIEDMTPRNYRGTYRKEPMYDESLPANHPVNLAARRYMDIDPSSLTVSQAQEIASLLAEYGFAFDIICLDPDAMLNFELNDFGYDVSLCKHFSLLAYPILNWQDDDPLLKVAGLFFAPLLNEYYLFAMKKDAELFLSFVKEHSRVCGSFESSENMDEMKPTRVCIAQDLQPCK